MSLADLGGLAAFDLGAGGELAVPPSPTSSPLDLDDPPEPPTRPARLEGPPPQGFSIGKFSC